MENHNNDNYNDNNTKIIYLMVNDNKKIENIKTKIDTNFETLMQLINGINTQIESINSDLVWLKDVLPSP